ncbi:hypothetical protein F2Q70_00004062 [Brassica cretica]|uniref:Uncharacterized protein n=1 Tax=Brassica cretica TaxID=69181 RepID=A0A8S9ISW8_BRACR|nr:hypothetical protein F2Q70_00004062 [Brassica cretica]
MKSITMRIQKRSQRRTFLRPDRSLCSEWRSDRSLHSEWKQAKKSPTCFRQLARLKEMEGDCEDLVASAAVPDWSISELDLPQVSDDSADQIGGSVSFNFVFCLSTEHGFEKIKPRDSDRVRTPTCSANAERIRSGDVSEALTEVLREETRLPRASTQESKDLEGEKYVARVKSSSPTGSEGRDRPLKKAKANGLDHRLGVSGEVAVVKPFHWQFSHSKDCPITEDPDSVAHLVRHFKPAGCPLPSLRNMTEREAYVKMAMAHAKAMEANNEFAATLEKRLQDVPRSDELYEIKKVVRELKLGLKMAQDRERANAAQLATAEKLGNQAASLESRMRVVSNERKSALEEVSFLEAKVESSANKFSDDLRRATYDSIKALADSYLDVLVSLKEKWEKKKAATDCEARLKEVMENIDLLKEIMNNNLLASDELLRLRTKEVELGSKLDVMAVSDFSVGKLDLPQISEDMPEDFFARDSSAVNGAYDVTKCSGAFKIFFVWVVEIRRGLGPYKALLCSGTYHSSANAERIRSGDVREALTEVLREETRLPRASTQEVKDLEGEKSVARFSHSKDCPITEHPDSVAHLVRHFKPAGCLLPSLRNLTEREAYVKIVVAHAKATNEFAATLEKRLQDVLRSDELYEIKKVVREIKLGLNMAQDRERANAAQLAAAEKLGNQSALLEAPLRVVSNERKSALEQVSFLEVKVESSANKFSDDLRLATYDTKEGLAESYLDVLVSLKEKWEKKKAATDCEARLREVMANIDILKEIMNNNLLASDELLRLRTKEVELGSELDVMAVLDFSVGKLDLPQITEDLPEDSLLGTLRWRMVRMT